jgi:ferredoxin
MSRRFVLRGASGTFPLTAVPAGIELAGHPDSVLQLCKPDRRVIVAEGVPVTAGTPLCSDARLGEFASVSGIVRRVFPWEGGERGKFTAVRIEREHSDAITQLVDPIADPTKSDVATVKNSLEVTGNDLPPTGASLLITLLDEDVGRVVNRWYLEKDFRVVRAGLQIIRHLYGTGAVQIAVSGTLSADRCGELVAFGRVIPVAPTYPQVLPELILRSLAGMTGGGRIRVLTAWHLAAMTEALTSGRAATTMPVAVRVGRAGQTRLLRVPIGMQVGALCAACGITVEAGMLVVMGGEMRGVAVDTLDQPLFPGYDAVLVVPAGEVEAPESTPCINCGRCYRKCPVRLRVDLLGRCVEFTKDEELLRLGIGLCIDCGVCASVCMVGRPLAHLMTYGKQRAARFKKEAVA